MTLEWAGRRMATAPPAMAALRTAVVQKRVWLIGGITRRDGAGEGRCLMVT